MILLDTVAGEDEPDPVPECRGHESTNGPAGVSVYCDGTCRLAPAPSLEGIRPDVVTSIDEASKSAVDPL
jgi:hypothetical protein